MCLKESRARGEQPERDCVWERLLQSRLVSRHRPPPIPWHLSTHLITHSHSTPPTTPSSASASLCVPVCATRKGTELNLRCAATVQHVLYQLSTLDSAIKRATPWTTRTKSWSQVSFAFDRKKKKKQQKNGVPTVAGTFARYKMAHSFGPSNRMRFRFQFRSGGNFSRRNFIFEALFALFYVRLISKDMCNTVQMLPHPSTSASTGCDIPILTEPEN